ncbi:MAG: efflux RND transporter periplasmic adaptor subunit [Alphaproteobacteria bacterium]
MAAGRRIAFLAVVAVIGAGALYAATEWRSGAGRVSASAPAQTGPKRIPVEASPVKVGTVIEDINVVGTLQPTEAVVVQPEIAGRIVKFGFTEGARAKKGDVLVELDPTILKAEMAKARSDLVLAKTNNDRAQMLASQGTGTLRARDEAQAIMNAATANFELAEARLDRASIRAPFAGVVGLRMFSLGAYVSPGDRIVELADIDPIRVDFRVSETALPSLRNGQPIAITVDALPGRTFAGEIYAIHPIVDENGRALRLRARIPNPDGVLYPGLFARVRIVIEQRDNAVLAPESAIFPVDERKFVYRVVDGKAVSTEVVLGRRQAGAAEVRSGLGPDAVVVTAGQQQIRDGALVEVMAPIGEKPAADATRK